MAKPEYQSVDGYIASQPEAVRRVLERVRSTIRKAVPRAEEVISYKIPAYRLNGKTMLFFAGWKQHWALYPASGRTVNALKDELSSYAVSKGTIRFPLSQPVPVRLIERIAKLREKEIAPPPKAGAPRRKNTQAPQR